MRGRYSPPPSSKHSRVAQQQQHPTSLLSRISPYRTRLAYTLLTLLLILLYSTSILPSVLPSHHHHAPPHAPSLIHKNIDWSRYAYSQYATNSAYLCNAVMVFESLARLGSKADRILFYPQEWDTDIADGSDRDSQLLVKARDWYHVKLIPVAIPKAPVSKGEKDDGKGGGEGADGGWTGGFTKFLNWRQIQYDRILHIDSDVTLLKHMDELFVLLPDSAAVAMFRAYWLIPSQRKLTSLFILLRPDEAEYQRLMAASSRPDQRRGGDWYDMEILNAFYGDSAMVLPHRQYGLLTGEFRTQNHANYLGNTHERWNGDLMLREASIVHFSDWPLPKPWIMWPHTLIGEIMPKCRYADDGAVDNCQDKEIWMGLYDDFRRRRKEVCAFLSAPAPEWPPRNKTGKEGG